MSQSSSVRSLHIEFPRSCLRIPLATDPLFTLPPGVSLQDVRNFPPFDNWCKKLDTQLCTFHNDIQINAIRVTSLTLFKSNKIGFINFAVDASWKDDAHASIPGQVFMRGGSVAILLIVRPETSLPSGDSSTPKYTPSYLDKTGHVVLTVQPRLPIANLSMSELPAGMLDDSKQFAGKAAQEIEEETGIKINEDDMVDMTSLLYNHLGSGDGDDDSGLYPSAGGCDEFLRLFACVKPMSRNKIAQLTSHKGGLRDEGERITLRLVPLSELWKSSRDIKVLASLQLYDQLIRLGMLK